MEAWRSRFAECARFLTFWLLEPTHTRMNIELIGQFLDVPLRVEAGAVGYCIKVG